LISTKVKGIELADRLKPRRGFFAHAKLIKFVSHNSSVPEVCYLSGIPNSSSPSKLSNGANYHIIPISYSSFTSFEYYRFTALSGANSNSQAALPTCLTILVAGAPYWL